MRSIETLETRTAMAVLDFMSGPYSSNVQIHGQAGDSIYLSADTENGRRLLSVVGEQVTDLGGGFDVAIWRGADLVGISGESVDRIEIATGGRQSLADASGARFLSDDTVYWLDEAPGRSAYRDIDGRAFEISGPVEEMRDYLTEPKAIVGGVLVANLHIYGELGGYVCTDSCVRLGDFATEDGLVQTGGVYVDYQGRQVAVSGERTFQFEGGYWVVSGSQVAKVVDGERKVVGTFDGKFSIPVLVRSDQFIFEANSELWGGEPWKATDDGVEFLGNWTFGRGSTFLRSAESDTGLDVVAYRVNTWERRLWLGESLGPVAPDAIATDYYYQVRYTEEHGDELHAIRKEAGDANYDGVFDSADLVQLFELGQYEDDLSGNSSWETGDFNGDGEFDSEDIVAAFQTGRYA